MNNLRYKAMAMIEGPPYTAELDTNILGNMLNHKCFEMQLK